MLKIWTDERIEQLKEFQADGLSRRDIAEKMECSRNAVCGEIHRLKLPPPFGKKMVAHAPRPASLPRRNPTHDLWTKIALAAADPGLPEQGAPDGTGIQIADLTKFTCRFPRGDPKTPEFEFCGKRPVEGCQYCAAHAQLVYQPEYCRRRADKALAE